MLDVVLITIKGTNKKVPPGLHDVANLANLINSWTFSEHNFGQSL